MSKAEKAGENDLRQMLLASIKGTEATLNQIAKNVGIRYSILWKFVNEGVDIRLATITKLMDYYNLKVTNGEKDVQPARKKK